MKTRLYLDEVEVELNDFVMKFFANAVEGAVSSLKDSKSDW